MNSKICLGISVLLAATACAPQAQMVQNVYAQCRVTGVVNINLRSDPPRVLQPHVCVNPGATIRFNLVPRPASTSVILVAKTKNPDGGGPGNWLTVINTANAGFMEATVPNQSDIISFCGEDDYNNGNCYFEYAVYARGKEPIDPRVTVRR